MKTKLKTNLLVTAIVCLAAGPTIALATVVNVNFTYTDPAAGNLTAIGTLTVDETTGQALSGSGTITSSYFLNYNLTPMGPRSFFLITPSNCAATTAPNKCSVSGNNINNWTDSDGTNLGGDTTFNDSTAPYVSYAGLIFAVGNANDHGTQGTYDVFNVGSLSASSWYAYIGAGGPSNGISGTGTQLSNEFDGGTLTINSITEVPVPAAAWLFGSGLGLLGALRRRVTRIG